MDRRLPVRWLLTEIRRYPVELWKTSRRGWDRFFFSRADPTALGVIRVMIGILGFWSLWVFGLDLEDYFGSNGWAEPATIRLGQRSLAWSFWFLVPDSALRFVWLLCLAILVAYTLGLFSRWTAVLTWIIVVSTVRRVPIALFGFDQVLSPLALYLAVTGASGQSVSLDRFIRRWREARTIAQLPTGSSQPKATTTGWRIAPSDTAVPPATTSANLALRLIQLHLVVIYGMAGLAKLQGASWWTGTALWGTMSAGEFVVWDFTRIAGLPRLINFLTHASLALELLYPVLIWVRIVRPLVLLGAFTMHTAIAIVSPGLTEFGLAMLAANLAFVSGSWPRRLATGPDQPALRVLFDGGCPRCRASIALMASADPDHVVEAVDLTAVDVKAIHPALSPAACFQSMHAITRAGRITRGFDAIRAIAGRLPLFWPFAIIAAFPGLAAIGRRVYNALAATRPRDVSCTDQTCGIHREARTFAPRHSGHARSLDRTTAARPDSQEIPHP
jgi:predicted DCC family thiol-disulfide oxidoreductase YuxK